MAGKHRKRRDNTKTTYLKSAALSGMVAASSIYINPPAFAASLETWERVAECESNNDWDINTGNGYSGGLQFLGSTWDEFGGNEFATDAYLATKSEQIQIAERVLDVQGWNAWPVCSIRANATNESAEPGIREIPEVEQPTNSEYIVVSGDILSAIANNNNTSVEALVEINDISNPDLIYPGDIIKIR